MKAVAGKLFSLLQETPLYLPILNRVLRAILPIYGICGVKVESVEGGTVRASVPLRLSTRNHIGIMHAAVLYMLGEFLGGVFIVHRYADRGWVPIAVEGSVKYKKMVKGTAVAECSLPEKTFARLEAEMAEKGRSRFTTDVNILNEKGETAATLRVEYLVRKG